MFPWQGVFVGVCQRLGIQNWLRQAVKRDAQEYPEEAEAFKDMAHVKKHHATDEERG